MAKDYIDIGIDKRMRALNNLSAKRSKTLINSFDFDSINDRGAVTSVFLQDASINNAKLGTAVVGTANIGTLSFNEISGGTATLGGTNDGDGLMVVNDEAGSERVKLDKTGIKVTGGSIIVEDDGGGTIIDSTGLVSTANFAFGQAQAGTGNQTFNNTTYTDVTGGSLDIILTRAANVLLSYTVHGYNVEFDVPLITRLTNNGTEFTESVLSTRGGYDGLISQSMSTSFISEIPSGTNTIKIQGKNGLSSGTAVLAKGLSNSPALVHYVVLGV